MQPIVRRIMGSVALIALLSFLAGLGGGMPPVAVEGFNQSVTVGEYLSASWLNVAMVTGIFCWTCGTVAHGLFLAFTGKSRRYLATFAVTTLAVAFLAASAKTGQSFFTLLPQLFAFILAPQYGVPLTVQLLDLFLPSPPGKLRSEQSL